MSARRKLNQGYVQGSLLIAGVIGAACGSWTVFWITTLILVALNIESGDVRLKTHRRGSRHVPQNRDLSDRHP